MLQALGGNGQVGDGDISKAVNQVGDEFITRYGNKNDVEFQRLGFILFIDKFFKLFEQIMGNTTLPPLI